MTIPTRLAKPRKISFQNVQFFYSIEQSCEFYIQFFLRTYLKMNLFRIKLLLQILFMNYSFIYYYQNGYFISMFLKFKILVGKNFCKMGGNVTGMFS